MKIITKESPVLGRSTAFASPVGFTPALSPGSDPERRVIVYIGGDPKRDSSMFYLNLFWCLMALGQKRGLEMIPVVDSHLGNSFRNLEPPEVAIIQKEGTVHGVIGFMLNLDSLGWIEDSGLPWMIFGAAPEDHQVVFDDIELVEKSLARLVDLGCKTAGLMIPAVTATAPFIEQVDAISERLGITVNYEWILVSRASKEQTGYDQFCALWTLRNRPEGLVVFPDLAARGVVSALLEKRVAVPEDLRLVLHRNAELPYFVPLPCDFIEVSINEIACRLLDNLEANWAGRPANHQRLPLRLVEGEA